MRRLTAIAISLWALSLAPLIVQGADGKSGMTPDEAMKRMIQGNSRYVSGKGGHARTNADRRIQTAVDGQYPYAAVLSCSDSRVPVEIICDEGLGDLFVIRIAGNVAGVDEVGSAEFAVDNLSTPLLVVLGHTSCGAVAAAATDAKVHGSLAAVISQIQPAVARVRKHRPPLTGDVLIAASIRANVLLSVGTLLKNSEVLRNRVKAGKLKVVGAIYDIKTGQISWLDVHPQQNVIINSASQAKPTGGNHFEHKPVAPPAAQPVHPRGH